VVLRRFAQPAGSNPAILSITRRGPAGPGDRVDVQLHFSRMIVCVHDNADVTKNTTPRQVEQKLRAKLVCSPEV